MSHKRFRTQRHWHNTLIMVWGIPFLVLPGIIVGASSGRFLLFQVMLGISLVGILLAARRDSRKKAFYSIDDDKLIISTPEEERTIRISEISDASLLDRVGARAFLKELSDLDTSMTYTEKRDAFMRFCTVDIGFRSFTLGAARRLIDRLPSAKSDLLLIRLRSGEVLLLSPMYAQDMVDTIGRRRLHG
ncbi:MAG TPA: hypothetical protein PKJ19_02350 [Flavobacteriales bacterium]|nr:hypothetical protein [Flavobacteriales bacterium]HNU57193.1 hypothetical protein [Flavobacteriales bacterium]